jgi:outer membrane scaffolding protein for murein synthesis (MipA/OmpV family)
VEVGGFVSFKAGPVSLDVRMTQDIANGHHGATLDMTTSLAAYQTRDWTVAPTVVLTWATARYMKSFFGITELQSERSGLPTYRAGSSLKDVSLGLLGSYDFSEHWSIFSDIGYKRMLGAAEDSPLVQLRGAPNQWHGALYLVYAF